MEESNLSEDKIVKTEIISVTKANLYSILLFFATTLLFGLVYSLFWGFTSFKIGFWSFFENKFHPFLIFFIGIILHEALHGITWAYFCKNGLKAIKYGVKWEFLTPYAHCKVPLKLNHYKLGGAMPGIVLGILPGVLGIVTGNTWLLFFGIFFTGAASGDLMVLLKLKNLDKSMYIQDHPDEIGFIVLKEI